MRKTHSKAAVVLLEILDERLSRCEALVKALEEIYGDQLPCDHEASTSWVTRLSKIRREVLEEIRVEEAN